MSELSIKTNNISKKFNIYSKPYDRFFEWSLFGTRKFHKEFWALKNINFQLNKGESLGIIGPNGAGKSTLLKILTGSLIPTTGHVEINGRVVSLLELGTGFHPELTGMQNIYNSTSLLGYEPNYIKSKIEDIIEFSGIGEFLEHPVKTYSSGMYVRLAFSLFANLDPDIYIVDEALAVGDVFFQQKCYAKLDEMKRKGVTIILVSHDPAPIIQFCDHVMIIDEGQIIESGSPSEIVELYQAREYSKTSNANHFQISKDTTKVLFGDSSVEIFDAELLNIEDKSSRHYKVSDLVSIRFKVRVLREIDNIIVGFQIKNRLGTVLYGTNSNWLKTPISYHGEKEMSFDIRFPVNLGNGTYSISLAVAEDKRFPERIFTWAENILSFEVIHPNEHTFGGELYLPVQINQISSKEKGDKYHE